MYVNHCYKACQHASLRVRLLQLPVNNSRASDHYTSYSVTLIQHLSIMQSILQYRAMQRSVRSRLDLLNSSSMTGEKSTLASPSRKRNHESLQEQRTTFKQDFAAPNQEQRASQPEKDPETATDFIVVSFEAHDAQHNPQNWSIRRKLFTTIVILGAGLSGGWASGNDSTIIQEAAKDFGVSDVVESLSTGVYLMAFGIGSLISGPFSETVGRNPVYICTLFCFMIFIMISALAPSVAVQFVFRFLAGMMGCTAVTTFAGSVADLWPPHHRALVFTLSSTINFCGVFLSPIVGAYIGQSTSLSWRWSEWVALLVAGFFTSFIIIFAPETYAPLLLSWKAAILRKETGDVKYRSTLEAKEETLLRRLTHSTWRPFNMLIHNMSVVLFTIYLTVIYIVSFTFLTGYTFIFGDIYHMSLGSVGLCFLGLDMGIIIATALAVPLHWKYFRDLEKARTNGHQSLPPEYRLLFAIITAPCLPIGLFWMAWTANESISFWSPLIGSTLIGVAFLGVFVSSYLYLIDSFGMYAASALSIATFCRYVAAGVMIPVSIPMYKNLGAHLTLTILGCISLVLTPIPFVMRKYGPAIRRRSAELTS